MAAEPGGGRLRLRGEDRGAAVKKVTTKMDSRMSIWLVSSIETMRDVARDERMVAIRPGGVDER